MFRTITENVPKPKFFLLCDHPHCGEYLAYDIPPVTLEQGEMSFVAAASKLGWNIRLHGQMCQHHAPSKPAAKLIEVAKTMPGVLQ